MRALSFIIAVVGLVTVASPLARAQEPDTLSPAQRAGVALARLGARQRVRIVTRDSEFVEGSVMAASPNLLRLRTDGTLMDLPASRVDSLWVRSGSHAGRGALIGGALGGIGMAALAAATTTSSSVCFRCNAGTFLAPAVVVGVAGGALVGALIGAAVPKWQLRVP